MAYDDNIQALLSAASIVRDETHEGGNTAARVGQLLVDMITSFDSAYKALSDSIPEGVDLSILKSYLSKKEAETLFDTQSVFNRLFVEDTTNNAIKALKHLYSVSDITAFGYVKTELPSEGVGSFGELSEVLALGAQSGTKYWGWNGTDYAWLSAPAGGAVDLSEYPKRNEFAALTLKVNGLYEQYLPLGTSIGLDLDAVYAKKGEGGNVNLDDYYKKTEITTLLEGYVTNDTLVTTVKDVKAYTDGKIAKLNIDQYAKASALDQVVADVNVAFDAVYNKFADYALLAGDNTLTGTNTFKGYLNLKRGAGASGTLFLQDDSEHTNYATQNGVYFVVSDGGFAIHAHKDGSWKNEIAWIDMSSLRTSLKQGISVPDITVRGGDALFNGKATFNANTYINAHTYINANSYITGRLYLSNGNSGVYFVCENNATYLYKHNNWSYDQNVTFFKLSALVGELGTRSGLVEIGEQDSPGTLKIGNAYITYDSDNNALFVKGKDGAPVNLVATGDVAAYSGLGSGFDTLTDLTLTNSLTVGMATLTSLTSRTSSHALVLENNPLLLGTPATADANEYRLHSLVAYKPALFKGDVTFGGSALFNGQSYINIKLLNVTSVLRINKDNDGSSSICIGGTSDSHRIDRIHSDGTNVYITINGKQYKLANA